MTSLAIFSLLLSVVVCQKDGTSSRPTQQIYRKHTRLQIFEEQKTSDLLDTEEATTGDLWASEMEVWERLLQDLSMSMAVAGFTVDLAVTPEEFPAGGGDVELEFEIENLGNEDIDVEFDFEPDTFDSCDDFFTIEADEVTEIICESSSPVTESTIFTVTVRNVDNGEEVEVEATVIVDGVDPF